MTVNSHRNFSALSIYDISTARSSLSKNNVGSWKTRYLLLPCCRYCIFSFLFVFLWRTLNYKNVNLFYKWSYKIIRYECLYFNFVKSGVVVFLLVRPDDYPIYVWLCTWKSMRWGLGLGDETCGGLARWSAEGDGVAGSRGVRDRRAGRIKLLI